MVTEVGLIVDFLEKLGVPSLGKSEPLSEHVKRAFQQRATIETGGLPASALKLTELGGATLLSCRMRFGGNSKFSRVDRDVSETNFEYSVRREGKTDEFRVTSDRREYRKLTFRKPQVIKRIGELNEQRQGIEAVLASQRSSLEMTKMNFDRKMPADRNLSSEAAVLGNFESEIRVAESKLPGIDEELRRLQIELDECSEATLDKYSTLHKIPSDKPLEVYIVWPQPG